MDAPRPKPAPRGTRPPRVLVTREREAAGELADLLRAEGAQPILLPAIRIEPPDQSEALDAALRRAADYDWVLFTSVNAVASVHGRLEALGLTAAWLGRTRIGAVGPRTWAALTSAGVEVQRVPPTYTASALAGALGDLVGRRVLLPRSDLARPDLARLLREAGAEVDDVVAYRNVPADPDPAGLAEAAQGIDVAAFASGSAVRNLVGWLGRELPADFLAAAAVACIGPTTADVARELGISVRIEADTHTAAGLVEAIMAYWREATRAQYRRP